MLNSHEGCGGRIHIVSKEKGRKIVNNRLKKVDEETLDILYGKLPFLCKSCCYNCGCPQSIMISDTDNCNNYKMAYELNEIIEMLRELNVNLQRLSDNYGLKIKYLRKMLKGETLMSWKYYSVIMDRVLEKNEFLEYESRFMENEIDKLDNNISECEVMNK